MRLFTTFLLAFLAIACLGGCQLMDSDWNRKVMMSQPMSSDSARLHAMLRSYTVQSMHHRSAAQLRARSYMSSGRWGR